MDRNNFSRIVATAVLFLFEAGLFAQISSSPYSIFGLGSTDGTGAGAANGLGGTGIALNPGHTINLLNPAAAAGMDTLVSFTEIGFQGKYTSFKSSDSRQSLFDGNFSYAAMSFRVKPRWAVTAGISPYSTIGYTINVPSELEGTANLFTKTYSGQGGVNKLFLSNSFRLTPRLLFGVSAVYLFGAVTHTESSADFDYTVDNTSYISNVDLNWGLIWKTGDRDRNFSVGLTYDNGRALRTATTTTLSTSALTEVMEATGTSFRVPRSAGLGIAFSRDNFRGGLDFETRYWSRTGFENKLLRSRNSRRYSAGLEIPSGGNSRGSGHMVLYRLGAQYCESYMIIKGAPINYRSVSMGLGIPAKGFLSIFNLSLEVGQNGTLSSGLFRETFCTFHADISLKDVWFMKRRYN